MKKMCAKCGGATKTKMAKGGSMKTTVGSKSAKSFIAGIPNGGPTGPNYQGVDTMKKGGSIKKKYQIGGSKIGDKIRGVADKIRSAVKKAPTPEPVSPADRMYTNTTPGQVFKPGMKKGGVTKKMQDGGPIIKSKKTRNVNINSFGDSSASVSKTKRDGTTVTKKTTMERGYVPTASKSKTVTDKEGNTISSTSKSVDYNKAYGKIIREGKRVGRNPNDEGYIDGYKKGGATKKMAKGGSTFGMLSIKAGIDKNPKPTAADRIAGAKMSKKKMGGSTKKK